MKKIYKVESKYKNPDKYIEKLKNEIRLQKIWARQDAAKIQDLHNLNDQLKFSAHGKHWFSYSDGVDQVVSLSHDSLLDGIKLGQEVWLCGKITKFTRSIDNSKSSARFSLKNVYRKD